MANNDIAPKDVKEFADFAQGYISSKVPDGDYTRGSVLYDHNIEAAAFLGAFLRKEIQTLRDRQSLLTLSNLPSSENVSDAADAILANVLLTRSLGPRAFGPVLVHLSQKTDLLIRRSDRFYKTRSIAYVLDSPEDTVISASNLRPNIGADGVIIDWVVEINLVAARPGRDYNQPAGAFIGFTRFNPFVTYIENTVPFTNGDNTQDTRDFIANAENAITLRLLLNPRSNAVVLSKLFPGMERVVTIGMSDPEMIRDYISERASGIALHVGGKMDIYIRRAVQQITERLTIAEETIRPDGKIIGLNYPSVNFITGAGLTAPVVIGDILLINSGIPEAPFEYKIADVYANDLFINSRLPFTTATDELLPVPSLTFSIGNNYPNYDNKLSTTTTTLATTNRKISIPNGVVLNNVPAYKIKTVELIDPPASLLSYQDPTTNTIRFTFRTNSLPAVAPTPGSQLPFIVEVINPTEAQSGSAITTVKVGWTGLDLTGLHLDITYDTLSGFSDVDSYIRDLQNRPSACDILARAHHPIYLSFTIPYAFSYVTSNTPQFQLSGQVFSFDETVVGQQMVDYVNAYTGDARIDQSAMATRARELSGTTITIYPFSIFYSLYGPDGKVYNYSTEDDITVFPTGTTSSRLLNPTEVGLPATNYYDALRKQLRDLGVSDRTTRYCASVGAIAFARRN